MQTTHVGSHPRRSELGPTDINHTTFLIGVCMSRPSLGVSLPIIRTQKRSRSVIEFELLMSTALIHVIRHHDTSDNLNWFDITKACAVVF